MNGTSGTGELNDNENLNIYPNPLTSQAVIEYERQGNEVLEINILDGQGRILRKIENIFSNKIIIEKKDLCGGMYFIQLVKDNHVVVTAKLIVACN